MDLHSLGFFLMLFDTGIFECLFFFLVLGAVEEFVLCIKELMAWPKFTIDHGVYREVALP